MSVTEITGTRIRDSRIDQGIKQADLAQSVGISAPYLNLIEHNRRRIAGKLLIDIARALNVPAEQLNQGVDATLLDQMNAAAADMASLAEVARTEDLATKFPGWAALIVAQAQRVTALQDRVQSLTDRMTYDPALAGSLHQVISAVTSVRSAASILAGAEALDADWQARFHRNIYEDSVRLVDSSAALIRYLEAPETDGAPRAPLEEVEAAFVARDFHIKPLEQGARVDATVAQMGMASAAATQLLTTRLTQYQTDAQTMPLARFSTAARDAHYDPAKLAAQFAVPLDAVLRRLASLPAQDGHPAMGLVEVDASGALLHAKAVRGFTMPRAGAGCPLWPVFTAFGRPDQPIRAIVTMPDVVAQQILCYAIARPVGAAGFDAPPVLRSTMLVIPDHGDDSTPPVPVGVSCRICPRSDCTARREPSALVL